MKTAVSTLLLLAIYQAAHFPEVFASPQTKVVDGYFVHFYSPELPPMPKDIIFILDVSGSMYGNKIQQMKDAMLAILNDLQPEDRFNIITFSSRVERWGYQLATAKSAEIYKAKQFIRSLEADGVTNINDALLAGISELSAREDNQRVGMIFFLTNGQATEGITDSAQITANVLSNNNKRSAIYCLAFGTGADYDLLTEISGQNSGFTRKIYEDSDAALQIEHFYKEISVNYLPGSAEINGFQKSGSLNLIGEVDDVKNLNNDTNENQNTMSTIPQNLSGLEEKMQRNMTVKQYLKEKKTYASNEEKVEELKNKILPIAMKYKLVTPLTTMVVTKPESPDKPIESGLEDTYDQLQNTPVGTSETYRGKRAKGHVPDLGLYYYQKLVNSGLPPTTTTPAREPATSSEPTTKYTSQIPTEFVLSAIIAETSDNSICLAQKSVKEGRYNLIQSPNGSELDIDITCSGKKCKIFLVKSIILKLKGNVAQFSVSESGEWMYPSATFFSVMRTNENTFTISVEDFEVTAKWVEKNGSRQYTLVIKVNSAKGYDGIIGQVLNMKAKKMNKLRRKGKVPAECSDASADISKFLKKKMAKHFRI